MDLILENIRSFDGRHVIPIRPLTLLTGENSAGKSTVLAILSLICNPSTFPLRSDFNQRPFELGNFDTIATYKGGKYGRADFFAIGYEQREEDGTITRRVEIRYRSAHGKPEIAHISVLTDILDLTVDLQPATIGRRAEVRLELRGALLAKAKDVLTGQQVIPDTAAFELPTLVLSATRDKYSDLLRKQPHVFGTLYGSLSNLAAGAAVPAAPIRTKPKRTYDQVTSIYSPEGDHIPYVLSEIFHKDSSAKKRDLLGAELEKYGSESGLFDALRPRYLGKKLGAPFQLMVKAGGVPRNVSDVGYGISQVLPLVVQSALESESRLFLLQQPEVHLHPRAQAALGSFFARATASGRNRFVVETHSDYIIDRIRLEISRGTVGPNDVQLLFLEKKDAETRVFPLSLDMFGNIERAPASYRQFFLEEEMALLKRASGRQ